MIKNLTCVGKYKCNSFLGSGNFGAVYEAFDRVLQQPRAIKVIQCQNANRFIEELTEARLLEICRHKHVVEVKEADIYSIKGKDYVVISTELLPEGSAQDMLKTGYVSLRKSKEIICDALFGLEHLHNNGIVHCDIKPGNILLTKRKRAKLSDFGLAIRLKQGQTPQCVYTLHMAPENSKGLQGTVLSDIYAMGVTSYRLFNNIADFKTLAPRNVRRSVLKGEFPDRGKYSSYVPTKIKRIINKAMHVDPKKRYQFAAKFRQALEKINFGIDWECISTMEWKGKQGQNYFQIFAILKKSGWSVEFRQNNRRKNNYCHAGLKDNWQANAYICKLVADTSIIDL